MPNTNPRLIAGGDILPSTFVTMSGDDEGSQAGAGDALIGIAMEGTNYAPIDDPNITVPYLAARQGQHFKLYGQGDECLLVAGTLAGIAPGVRLKSDATGGGIVAGATEASGAICLETPAAVGELFRVQVELNPAAA